MTARIETLDTDLQNVIGSEKGRELAKEAGIQIGALVAKKMEKALSRVDRPRRGSVLFPSELGHPCSRKTWFEFFYDPATMLPKEQLTGMTRIKFAYGDIVEALIVPLIHLAGHEVTDVGARVEWKVPGCTGWTVEGNMDCRVDGHVVDVKSMNAFSFDKWCADPEKADGFGYGHQIYSYVYPNGDEPEPHILGVNKENGKIRTFKLKHRDVASAAKWKANEVSKDLDDIPRMPQRAYGANLGIGTVCSYCAYKAECWKDANGGKGLRKFIYSDGPKFLTEVVNEPRVAEVPL